MGAKNKPPKRPILIDEQEVLRVHLQATQMRDELLAEAEKLRKAGKISRAREVLKRAEAINQELERVERERSTPPL